MTPRSRTIVFSAVLVAATPGGVSVNGPGATPGAAPGRTVTAGTGIDRSLAAAYFERLKSLAGDWEGKSTRGWVDRVTYRTIAAGSVVMATSFEAHPDETMVTMYHMDGDRLMLTHYCVAKNQPRLVATEFSREGKSATFTFLDATGIPSRDGGHMDRVVMTIDDADHFTSRWTWYQQGKERWLEEIRHERSTRPAYLAATDRHFVGPMSPKG